ncbi:MULTISPECIES: helix-turn-helix domain-containing protein [Clostridium]|uniref:AraC family regulatory protein n=2 Tax=Clostridium sporogenes TaxID=1509 RepID=A0A7X5P864_CLOSG|nr:AraC family transcriptional regulator [Clostridium sporogenes]AJD32217.1 helix-turn-helix domain protein [Clostridium botulinum Prevot_594]AVP61440.1 AraC family transcriptional regulator [Clostridium botulinum]AKC61385.1 AraC family regulatory protein [Clostridium sporogenes]KCZ68688.1 AraC family regulatory protein [Clostridium sporogenes]KRU41724.1 AraC family transcriptional regulator [Clostridium sporogenes]
MLKESDMIQEHELLNKIASIQKCDKDGYRTIYKMDCLNGVGTMMVYKVFTGIELIINEFESTTCLCNVSTNDNIIEINHCEEGRQECEFLNGSYLYLGEGDLSIHTMNNHAHTMGFPLKYYKGISVLLYLDEIARDVPEILKDISIDIYGLKEKFCINNECFVMRANDKIKNIFSELYYVPESVQKAYFKLKVLELLMFLNIIDVSKKRQGEYYSQQQVETIKQIKKLITEDFKHRYTIQELSKKYCISQTTLKTYFKGIYGTSMASYMKEYRMKQAAVMLRETSNSVADIAISVSYQSQSKFAASFKEIIGISPFEYRKKCLAEANISHQEYICT